MYHFNDVNCIRKFNTENIEENLERMMNLMNTILELIEVARTQGLLALEEYFAQSHDDYEAMENKDREILKYGIQLIIDGTDPEIVEEIMLNTCYSNCYDESDTFICNIICKGTLMIQKGYHPRMTTHLMLSLISLENIEKLYRSKAIKAHHKLN